MIPPPFPLFFCHSRRDSNAHCISLNSIFLVMMKILQRLFYFYQYSLQKEQTDYDYMRKLWKIVPACVVWPGLICDNTIIVSKKTYVSHIMYIYHIVSLALLLKYFFTWYLHGRLPHFLSTWSANSSTVIQLYALNMFDGWAWKYGKRCVSLLWHLIVEFHMLYIDATKGSPLFTALLVWHFEFIAILLHSNYCSWCWCGWYHISSINTYRINGITGKQFFINSSFFFSV